MHAKFGTSGLRGLVEDLDKGAAAAHTMAFLRHLKSSGQTGSGDAVYFGQDLRPSSAQLAAKCMAATEDEGFVPVDCGALPTPALANYAMARNAASIMITGSHIPADRNGVKFYRPDGEIDKIDEAAISALVGSCNSGLLRATPHHKPAVASQEAVAEFIRRYDGFLPKGALKNLRIGIYEHSTVIRDMLAEILAPTGAEIIPLGHSETFVPVDTEAVSDATSARFRAWTQRYHLDAVVSADGDADRPLLADETGDCIRGDTLGLITALYLGAEILVTPITSNSGIEARFPGEVFRTKVGSPFVIAGMAQMAARGKGTIIGFEANGGVLTASEFSSGSTELAALPTRDCVLPILSALAATVKSGRALSDIVTKLALPVAANGRMENFAPEGSTALIEKLGRDNAVRAAFFEPIGTVTNLDLTDGLRMTLADRRILHLRPSGNAPEMRIYTEAADKTSAGALVDLTIARVLGWAG